MNSEKVGTTWTCVCGAVNDPMRTHCYRGCRPKLREPVNVADLTKDIDAPKSSPQAIVAQALDALEAGEREVLADELTRQVKQGLTASPAVYL